MGKLKMLNKVALVLMLSIVLYADNIFYDGKTYEFAEKNLLEEMQEYIHANKNEINDKLKVFQKKAKKDIKSYKPKNIKLSKASKNHTFYPDMTYVNEIDIKDHDGKVIYPKGFKFNPLQYLTLPYKIIVIDATVPGQIKWLKEQKVLNTTKNKILLSDGNYQDLIKELNQPVFYLTAKIIERFDLKYTPSIIKQIDKKMEVREVYVKDIY